MNRSTHLFHVERASGMMRRDRFVFRHIVGNHLDSRFIILEDGKYYFPMKVMPRRKGTEKTAEGQMAVKKTAVRQTEADQTAAKRQPAGDVSDASWTDMCDRYGELLIRGKDPLLMQYLKERERILAGILESLKAREGNLATQGENLKTQGENLMAQEDDQKASGKISSRERRFLEVRM